MLKEIVSGSKFQELKSQITKDGFTQKEILLETLCAVLGMYLVSESDHDEKAKIVLPLVAQLHGLGVIELASSH